MRRPDCHLAFKRVWNQLTYEQSADEEYRGLYYYLHKFVDRAIEWILEELDRTGLADETIVVSRPTTVIASEPTAG